MNETTETRRYKMTTRQILLGGTALVVVLAAISFGSGSLNSLLHANDPESGEAQFDQAPPLPVNLQTVHFVDSIEQSRTYTGMIRARRRSDLAFELAGKIESVLVDEGQQVKQGEPLAQLDTETLAAQRKALAANLNQATSVLEELNAGPRIEKINSAQADVAARRSEYENAMERLKRRQTLFEKRAIPIEELNQSAFTAKTSKAMLDAAKERLAELEAGTRAEKIAAQQATVQSLTASLDEVDVAIRKSRLLAPFAATVTKRFLDPGSIAQPSVPVVRLVEHNKLEAWIGLPADVAAQVNLNEQVYLDVAGARVRARSIAKVAEIDPATRTQTVIYDVNPIASNSIVSGQLCKIEIASVVNKRGAWIPNTALNKGVRGLWSVLVVAPDEQGTLRAFKRDIEIIKAGSQRVLAKGTIEEGDRIVADGVHRITEGQAVADAEATSLADK